MSCSNQAEAEAQANAIVSWTSDHKDQVVGALIIVGGVVFIIATDGAGAIILLPVRA